MFLTFSSFYLNKISGLNQVKSVLIPLLSFLAVSIQYIIYISFLSSYAKSSEVNCEFTNVGKGYFQTIRIVVLQNLIALLIFIALVIVDGIIEKELFSSIAIKIIIVYSVLWILWNIRMLFVTQIVLIKRNKYIMKEIIKESVAVIKGNIRIVIFTLAMQILFLTLFVFITIKGNYNLVVTTISSIFSLVINWFAILVYSKVFIEYCKTKYGLKNELTHASTL